MKQRQNTVIMCLLIRIPFVNTSFNSITKGLKNSLRAVGFPSPHHTEITIGLISGISMS